MTHAHSVKFDVDKDLHEFFNSLVETPTVTLTSPKLPSVMSYAEDDNFPYRVMQKDAEDARDGTKMGGPYSDDDPRSKLVERTGGEVETSLVLKKKGEGPSPRVTCKYDWRHRIPLETRDRHEDKCPTRSHLTKHVIAMELTDGTKSSKVTWERGVPWGYKNPGFVDLPPNKEAVEEVPMEMRRFVIDAEVKDVLSLIQTTSVWVPGAGFVASKTLKYGTGSLTSDQRLTDFFPMYHFRFTPSLKRLQGVAEAKAQVEAKEAAVRANEEAKRVKEEMARRAAERQEKRRIKEEWDWKYRVASWKGLQYVEDDEPKGKKKGGVEVIQEEVEGKQEEEVKKEEETDLIDFL